MVSTSPREEVLAYGDGLGFRLWQKGCKGRWREVEEEECLMTRKKTVI